MTVLEGMNSGLPVIATKVGALPEIIEDGVNDFLTDEVNIDSIKNALIRAIRDTELLSNMSNNNIGHVKKNFSINSISENFEDILAGV